MRISEMAKTENYRWWYSTLINDDRHDALSSFCPKNDDQR